MHTQCRRLTLAEAIRFAGVLPPVLRALFVADWDTNEPRCSFGDRTKMAQEVQALRADHNFAPDTAIEAVAIALRKNIDEAKLDDVLHTLSPRAYDFWCPSSI